jgi:hypothetical protein
LQEFDPDIFDRLLEEFDPDVEPLMDDAMYQQFLQVWYITTLKKPASSMCTGATVAIPAVNHCFLCSSMRCWYLWGVKEAAA